MFALACLCLLSPRSFILRYPRSSSTSLARVLNTHTLIHLMHTSYCGDRYLAITTTRTGPLIAGVGNFSQFSALPDNRVVLMLLLPLLVPPPVHTSTVVLFGLSARCTQGLLVGNLAVLLCCSTFFFSSLPLFGSSPALKLTFTGEGERKETWKKKEREYSQCSIE